MSEESLLSGKHIESAERRFTVLSNAELLEGVVSLNGTEDEDWKLYCDKSENAART